MIRTYKDNFAYGFEFKTKKFTAMKENGVYYIRNNINHKFESKFDAPPVTAIYDFQSSDVEDIIKFALN